MEADKPATGSIKIVDDSIRMLHASRLFNEAVNNDSLVSVLDDGLASEDKVWQCKCKLAKLIIDKDKENAEKSIRDLYRILVGEISKTHNIKLLNYEVPLSCSQIEQTIGDAIFELFKVVSESNAVSSKHIHTQNSHPLLRFASLLGKNQLLLKRSDKIQLEVTVFYDMIHSYHVYYYGSEDDLRQLTFADLRKSLKDRVKYSYVFAYCLKVLKDGDTMWKIDNKRFDLSCEIAKFWPDMSCREQDRLVACLERIGYDEIKLFEFTYKKPSEYLYYSTFKKIGFQEPIMLFCQLLPQLINRMISIEEIQKLERILIKEYSTRDNTPSLKLSIHDIIEKNKADFPTLSVSDLIKRSVSILTSLDDRLRIISDTAVDLWYSHHFVCMIDVHNGPQPMDGVINQDLQAYKYKLIHDCKMTGRHVCVYEKCGDVVNND